MRRTNVISVTDPDAYDEVLVGLLLVSAHGFHRCSLMFVEAEVLVAKVSIRPLSGSFYVYLSLTVGQMQPILIYVLQGHSVCMGQ